MGILATIGMGILEIVVFIIIILFITRFINWCNVSAELNHKKHERKSDYIHTHDWNQFDDNNFVSKKIKSTTELEKELANLKIPIVNKFTKSLVPVKGICVYCTHKSNCRPNASSNPSTYANTVLSCNLFNDKRPIGQRDLRYRILNNEL